jgi:hypothetical protein
MSEDYDAWFQRQVRRGQQEADDPKTEWVSHDQSRYGESTSGVERRIEGMGGDYTRCGTPLVYAGRFELQPDILAETGEQKKSDQEASPSI